MAIQSFQLDPNAASYTDDEIVGKVNAAGVNISRAGAVEAAARPIEADEIGPSELAANASAANLDAMADDSRGYVQTNPLTGEFPVVAIQRAVDGKLDIDFDDVPIA